MLVKCGGDHDPRRAPQRIHLPGGRRCAGAQHRLWIRVHRRADLAPRRAPPALLRHAGRRAPALGRVGRRARGRASRQQVQRHDLRRGSEPHHLRALHVEPGAPSPLGRTRSHRLALRRQGAQQPQRRVRALRRLDLLQRSVVRAHARFRSGAPARTRLAGSVPRVAVRSPPARRRPAPLRPAERTLLLARREQALHQRHHASAHPGLRCRRRRIPVSGTPLRAGHTLLSGSGRPGRDEVRREGQRLADGAGGHPHLLARRRAARHRAHPRDAGEPALGRAFVSHALRVRDDLGVRGRDEGRAAHRALHAPGGRGTTQCAAPRAAQGRCRGDARGRYAPTRPFLLDGGHERLRRHDPSQWTHPRPGTHRPHHPGHAARRGLRGRRLRRQRLAPARARAERGREHPPLGLPLPLPRG